MEKIDKISIIVPIYGVEKYINHGIEAMCNQTYDNLEIILVDDGSKDRSGEICDEWAKKDARIKVLHIQNAGQSHARNEGLKVATGQYIGFVDGDDAPTPRMYETLLKRMKENHADIGECNFVGRKSPEPDNMEEGKMITMSGREAIERQLDSNIRSRFPSTSLWSKLFRADILQGRMLPAGRIHEEYAFLCEAFLKCKNYVYLNERLYERTLRDDSTTAEKFTERTFDKLEVFRMRNQYLKSHGEEKLYKLSRMQEFELMLHYYGEARNAGLDSRAKQLLEEIRNAKKEILKSSLSKGNKIKSIILMTVPNLYSAIRKRTK